jgi:RHS repeat-associated protein
LDQRLIKFGPTSRVDSGARYFAYDEQGHLIGEYDQEGNPGYEVVYLGDTPVALITQTRTGSGSTLNVVTSLSYVYADHLDTARVIVRSGDHAVQWRWDQAEAFGNAAPNENPNNLGVFTFNLRFPGQTFDKEAGLSYNHHRDRRAMSGRYVQADPIGPAGGINTYAYLNGQPTMSVDPQGLAPMPKWWTDGWEPTTPPGNCATAECAAGVLPTPKPNPTECEMQCGLGSADAGARGVVCAAVAQGGKLLGIPGIPVTLACKAIDKHMCMKECEEKKKCQ